MKKHSLSNFILLATALCLTACEDNDKERWIGDVGEPFPVLIEEGENLLTVPAEGGSGAVTLNEGTVSIPVIVTATDLFAERKQHLWNFLVLRDTEGKPLTPPGMYPTKELFDELEAGDVVSDWFVERDMLGSGEIFDYAGASLTRDYVRGLTEEGIVLTSVHRRGTESESAYEIPFRDWGTVTGSLDDDGRRKVTVSLEANPTDAERVVCIYFFGSSRTTWEGPLMEINNVIRVAQPAR